MAEIAPNGKGNHGGRRPGAGRPKGAKNGPKTYRGRRIRLARNIREAKKRAVTALLRTGLDPFPGDAHALLVWAYKNPELPAELRLDAAKAAVGFERPRLATTNVFVRRPRDMTDEELAAATTDAEAEVAALTGLPGGLPAGNGPTKH